MNFNRTSLDANHKEIADFLRRNGVEVIEILDPLDLLCERRGFVGFIEIKVPTKRELSTRKQLKFIAETRVPVAIAKTADEAMQFLKTRSGLTQKQKDGITAMLLRDQKKLFTSNDVEKAILI